jgi:hypothetical protein
VNRMDTDGLIIIGLLALGVFLVNVAILRYIFRVNQIVSTLESIELSLRLLPAVQAQRGWLDRSKVR